MPRPEDAPPAPPPEPRGAGWVALQVLAGAAVIVVAAAGPRPARLRRVRRVCAMILGAAGAVVVLRARRDLGDAFSVFPRPTQDAQLATGGMYGRVRHPMYTGVLAQAAATALAGSPWAFLPAGALAVILDRKAAYEERALARAHPDAAHALRATRWRFVPGLR